MFSNKSTILIVDDEKSVRRSFEVALEQKYSLLFTKNGKEAITQIPESSIDLVLLDMMMPGLSGLETLEQIKALDKTIPVIMVTAVKTVDSAVSAMKMGAYDYLVKPFDIEELGIIIEKALENRILQRENLYLKAQLEKKMGFEKIIGKSSEIKEVFDVIDKVASGNSTILVTGESGTGKELVARAIHNRSPRSKKLFVAINCAAIPDNLLESELFGHEKGAFTGALDQHLGKFEIAHKGTIFLDEISSLPLSMQAKLLRVLQEKTIERVGSNKSIKVDVRIVAATNIDLKKASDEKKFRNDLYYRLNVIPIHLPPLRERGKDIELLINFFLKKYNMEFGKKVKGFSGEAISLLTEYDWPGNIRELENLIERLVVLGKNETIGIEKLPFEISKLQHTNPLKSFEESINESSEKFTANFIESAIKISDLNDRQLKAIDFVKKEGKITKDKYMKLTNTTKTTAFRDLNNLVKLDIFVPNGTGKSTYYTLNKE